MSHDDRAGGESSRLFVYNGGFLRHTHLRRILGAAGYPVRFGLPGPGDAVGVWGHSPYARRGEAVAARRGVPLIRIEDAFLRSLYPGRARNEPPLGLVIDRSSMHFDGRTPSDLEQILTHAPLDDSDEMARARAAIARMKSAHLSKYNAFDPALPAPDPGYVLVVDQTEGDASVTACGADRARFLEMLVFAQEENPGAKVLIKTHPETAQGLRAGYFQSSDASARVTLFDAPISPWTLLEGAVGVYTVSSQLGFEAILAGHNPRVFGQPFYAGWGLTRDEMPVPRRERRLTRAQLFAGAMMHYPVWFDPYRGEVCEIETALDILEARARAWREDYRGWTAMGMRLWKRLPLQRFYGGERRVVFRDDSKTLPDDRPVMVWACKSDLAPETAVRAEDGFFRSHGLGAALVPPLSLVSDRRGIYYDPRRESDLEAMIGARESLNGPQRRRAEALIGRLVTLGLSKYNLGGARPDLPEGPKVLVPGQVEDDASILTGAAGLRSNADLLRLVRRERPDAQIIYKPHPDVTAGLRAGALAEAEKLADLVATDADISALLDAVDEVWTITSLTGFEALLRGVRVTTLGAPFYAGWGLTRDLGEVPRRRRARPDLAGLVHAALIDYPRYFDPVTGLPCPVEVAMDRLASGRIPHPGTINRTLSKLQGIFAGFAPFWR